MNIDKLRKDLINYFGTATHFIPIVILEISRIEKANEEELIKIAKENNFDLSKY